MQFGVTSGQISGFQRQSIVTPMNQINESLARLRLPAAALVPLPEFRDSKRQEEVFGRLHLYSKGRAIDCGLIAAGVYGVPEDEDDILSLGPSVDVLPLARRAKAIDMSDKEAIITSYDAQSAIFKDIRERSNSFDSCCMYGVTFLIFERITRRFLELYCGSRSTRTLAERICRFLPIVQQQIDELKRLSEETASTTPRGPIPITLGSALVGQKKSKWHVPTLRACEEPFAEPPHAPVVEEAIERFFAIEC